uniref:hypothetical protein n=1 Tax=uncultured Draconibacterium sp. TaxID=1573823 RepID=UPI003217ADC9
MPMQDYSTLIYFINDSQNESKLIDTKDVDTDVEGSSLVMDFEPSERSVKNILDFARSYDTLETESTGYVELNLN